MDDSPSYSGCSYKWSTSVVHNYTECNWFNPCSLKRKLDITQLRHILQILGTVLVISERDEWESKNIRYLRQLGHHKNNIGIYPTKKRYNMNENIDYESQGLFCDFPGRPLNRGSQRTLTYRQFRHIELDAYPRLRMEAEDDGRDLHRHIVLCIDQLLHHCRIMHSHATAGNLDAGFFRPKKDLIKHVDFDTLPRNASRIMIKHS